MESQLIDLINNCSHAEFWSGEISSITSILPFQNFNLYGPPSSRIYSREDFEKGRSVEVDFKIITEDWNVYRVSDGSRLKVRQVVSSIRRMMLDMYDSHGMPIYILDSTNIINVDFSERRLSDGNRP